MMNATHSFPSLSTQTADIRQLLQTRGPCVTLVLPPYHPGRPEGSGAALLKAHLQDTYRKLKDEGISETDIAHLLEPLERLAEDPGLATGSHLGRALLRSSNEFRQFPLLDAMNSSLSVGETFDVRCLSRELARPPAFHILALTKKGVTLLRCSGLEAEVVSLPPAVPATLVDFLDLDAPDHNLENRSAAGASVGAMCGVRFGTGSARERQHSHLSDYYKMVDRGLQQSPVTGTPLLLAGVAEDLGIYRGVATHPNLFAQGLTGSPDVARERIGLLKQGYAILHAERAERLRAALITEMERCGPSRFSTNIDAILTAAFEGRIRELYLDENAKNVGICKRDGYRSRGEEDLMNLAAVQTIIHDGQYYELPGQMAPGELTAIGLLRF